MTGSCWASHVRGEAHRWMQRDRNFENAVTLGIRVGGVGFMRIAAVDGPGYPAAEMDRVIGDFCTTENSRELVRRLDWLRTILVRLALQRKSPEKAVSLGFAGYADFVLPVLVSQTFGPRIAGCYA